jgi:type IX secretion system PorP/SprF family membrane protein
MMKNINTRGLRLFILFLGMMASFMQVSSQDLHFSQFFHSPLSTNPANTGFIPASDYRLGAHYREQWASIPVPYKTMSIFGDFQFMRDRFRSGWMGLGGMILQDVAGTGKLRSTKAYASVAYHQMLGSTGLLSAGFNVGYAGKQINQDKLTFDNQWNGRFFDSNVPSGEIFQNNSIGYLDLQAGLNYAYFPSDNVYLHAGFSMHHLNKPKESFFAVSPGYDNTIQPRSIFFADAVIKLNNQIILSPGIYYATQAKSSELTAGMHLNYNIANEGDQQLILGVYFRYNDAYIPMVGYQWRNFKFSFSYDATNTPLKYFNNSRGATEMFMQYDGLYSTMYGGGRQSMCPTFKTF